MIEIFSKEKYFRLGSSYLLKLKNKKAEVDMTKVRLWFLTHWLVVERAFMVLVGVFIFFLLLNLFGCSGYPEIVKTTTEKIERHDVVPAVINENLKAEKNADTVRAYKIKNEGTSKADTVIRVEYYEKEKLIYVHVRPDTVKINDIDTVQTWTGFTENDMEVEYNKGFKLGALLTLLAIGVLGAAFKFMK